MEPSGVIDSLRRVLAACVVAALIAACAGQAAAPSSTAPTTKTESPAAQPSQAAANPSPTPEGPAPFRILGTNPVIRHSTFPDRGAVLPGAVAVDGDTYHAWIVAFADTPGIQELHYLTSPDAVSWTAVADPSLEVLSKGLGNPGAIPTTVIHDGDTWVMYFTGTLAAESQGWDLHRATAPSAGGPWTRLEAPVLRRGPAGAWDAAALDFPTVLKTDSGYVMVYSGQSAAQPEAGSIGVATSPDGIAWMKHDDPSTTDANGAESDPVMVPGLCGGFDDRAVHQPRVVQADDRLAMAYAGYAGALDSSAQVGFAESRDDGATWQCASPSPALDTSMLPPGYGLHTLVAFPRDDRVALLIEWLANNASDDWLVEGPPLAE